MKPSDKVTPLGARLELKASRQNINPVELNYVFLEKRLKEIEESKNRPFGVYK